MVPVIVLSNLSSMGGEYCDIKNLGPLRENQRNFAITVIKMMVLRNEGVQSWILE